MLKKLKTIPWLIIAIGLVFVAINAFAVNKRATSDKSPNTAVKKEQAQPTAQPQAQPAEKKLIVYYFMTTNRCRSCFFIETNTKAAVEEAFANDLKSGRIEFKMLNIDEPPNKHFVDEYGLFTKSVVLSDLKGGKQEQWKNLDQVWNLVGNEAGFRAYITKEVKIYLGS